MRAHDQPPMTHRPACARTAPSATAQVATKLGSGSAARYWAHPPARLDVNNPLALWGHRMPGTPAPQATTRRRRPLGGPPASPRGWDPSPNARGAPWRPSLEHSGALRGCGMAAQTAARFPLWGPRSPCAGAQSLVAGSGHPPHAEPPAGPSQGAPRGRKGLRAQRQQSCAAPSPWFACVCGRSPAIHRQGSAQGGGPALRHQPRQVPDGVGAHPLRCHRQAGMASSSSRNGRWQRSDLDLNMCIKSESPPRVSHPRPMIDTDAKLVVCISLGPTPEVPLAWPQIAIGMAPDLPQTGQGPTLDRP